MRFLILAGAASAAYLTYVALAPQFRDDPSAGQVRGWRACLSEESQADSCAPLVFATLEMCRAYIAVPDYDNESAECFDNIDEVKQ